MTKLSRKYIENIKNVILVVLFLTAVLLFYFFWQNDSLDAFRLPDSITVQGNSPAPEEPVPIEDVIQPEEISIHQGNGMYKVVMPYSHNIWLESVRLMSTFSKGQNLLAQEITAEEFAEVENLRYVQYRFGYSMPFSQFCEHYDLGKSSAFDSISRFTTILYTEQMEDNLFIIDRENGQYFRLISDNVDEESEEPSALSELIAKIERGNYPDYRTIRDLVGSDNDRLLPMVAPSSRLADLPYTKEDSAEGSEKSKRLAASFFGSSLDFVRTTTDKRGSIIYTYDGYRKIFTMGSDGTFEYREEVSDSSNNTRFFEALASALEFVSKNGGWSTHEGVRRAPYLENAEVTEVDGKRAYRFTFGIQLDGYKVYYGAFSPVIIEVVGTQVVHYFRDMVELTAADFNELVRRDEQPTYPPINVAANGSEEIAKRLAAIQKEQGEEVLTTTDFETVSQYIIYMRMGLLRVVEEEATVLKPVWVLKLKDSVMYFDLYTAEPIAEDLEQQ